jgi:hypothetical protein
MRNLPMVILAVFMSWMRNAQAQPLTVDPESIVPLPDKFDMETPAPDVPPEIARFQGAWIGTWHDDRHILVVERVTPDGHANVVFAQSDSALYALRHEPGMVAGQSNDRRRRADDEGISHLAIRLRWAGPVIPDCDHRVRRSVRQRHLRSTGPH